MYFLGIETATEACSVILYHNEKLISVEYTDVPKVHSKSLITFIQNVLQKASITSAQLNGIVVSEGPGSYTGLRIGMSTAKGMAYALDIPLMLIPSTMVIAYSGLFFIDKDNANVIGIIDAPNQELFVQCFTLINRILTPINTPLHVLANENILTELGLDTNKLIYLIGKGASKIKKFYKDNANVIAVEHVKQDMQNIGFWIRETYKNGLFADTELCEPLYVKDFSPTLKAKKIK
jgi:tRNA threonylcarbamoyladenosine biosynthesis protein TsaB